MILERHTYAPELNRLHNERRGVSYAAPGCRSIAEARKMLFARPEPGRVAFVRFSGEYGREYSGRIRNYKELARFIRSRAAWHKTGRLESVKIRLIG